MKLWDFLKSRMYEYGATVAFPDIGMSYHELIIYAESGEKGEGNLQVLQKNTRQELALAVLSCIAGGNVAIPVDACYGERYVQNIQELVSNDKKHYNELAFIVFTSGTTGIPKGVMLSDKAIIENLKGIEEYFRVEKGQKIMIVRPLVHIAVLVGELLFALYKGLEISFYEEPFSPARLTNALCAKETEIIGCTPTVLTYLSCFLKKTNITQIVISGERLSNEVIDKLREIDKDVQFYNVYGLTENSPRVCALVPSDFFTHPCSVGKPIKNTAVKVVNGELLVKSPSIMKGYFNRPDLTKRKVIDGWLHTGDAAEIDEEGYVYILGRIDSMIIRSGLNIFPEDIENEAKEITGIKDCIVYGRDDLRYGQKLYFDYTGTANPGYVRRRLAEILPYQLMPNSIRHVEFIETTVSGKKKR